MKALLAATGAAVAVALMWGIAAGARDAPPSADRSGFDVPDAWYASLSPDPEEATEAFLQRVPAAVRAKGDAYGATRQLTEVLRVVVLVSSIALMLFSGAAARMQNLAERATSVRPLRDALFAAQLFLALFLLSLPVDSYGGYVRVRQAGFSDRSYGDWLGQTALAWSVDTVFYVVGATALMALVRRRPASWPAWGVAIYACLSATYVFLTPVYIEPLFNRFTPLADGPAKEEIVSMARANGVPVDTVFVRDASRQSVLLNASVSGLAGTARIVLDDNTVAQAPLGETRMVMGHEIGHYVLSHDVKGILLVALVMGIGFVAIRWGARRLIERYGRSWGIPTFGDIASLAVLWGLFSVWTFLALPATNSITRQHEREADLYGLNAAREPIAVGDFMIRNSDAYQLDPSWLEEWFFFTHPSARSRIRVAMRWRAAQFNGSSGRPTPEP